MPSKHSSPDPFKDLSRPQRKPHTFQALSTFGSSSPRVCLYSRLWARKKNLYASCFSVQTQKRCSSRAHCHYRWQHRPMGVSSTGEGGSRAERGLGSGGWVVWAVWIHGWMDTWMWREKNAWMDSVERNDNGMRGQSLPHVQEMSTWGAGLNAAPSGRQLLGMCVSSQVRSWSTESGCDRYTHSCGRGNVPWPDFTVLPVLGNGNLMDVRAVWFFFVMGFFGSPCFSSAK